MCLVVRPGGGNGAGVVQETCDHAADQQWTPFAGTTQPDLIFKNPAGLCLAVSGGSTANGAGVIVFTCEAPGHLEQQWNPQG
jgi:hypothetical protein